ncbi:alpha/beta fold hydrolase [Adhaeribacter pallidiroseus]|uniref:2-hydroxy-6-oxonona-2,4-dienedioate hydrolase n=1 Tax=Adhaeribacter pallidiroseus TaxID=2072847 RepID=A0A369QFR9_9BACT|nr:alpha/beta hydrolase [Adhaeribacter pallidiroseus]RDC63763.1 2-hydroxy-6-oxonona-2,4-dienedioate hydrolase [Adhaeribacter pallidiroseus]
MRLNFLNFCICLCCFVVLTQPSFAQAVHSTTPHKVGSYFTSFDGTQIYYEVQGEGQPVILLHGFRNTLENWKTKLLYQDLIKNNFKVVVLDLRGNGKSDKPPTVAGYEKDAEARDVMGLATALKFKNYQVAGYSRGAIITAKLLTLDKRISAAVLGGMGEAFTNPNWPRRLAFVHALSGKETSPDLEEFKKSAREQGLDLQTLLFQQQAQPSTSPAELAQLQIPVLVIAGQEDNDNGSAEKLGKLFKTATVKRVPGVHNNAWQNEQFAQAVLTFLQQNK